MSGTISFASGFTSSDSTLYKVGNIATVVIFGYFSSKNITSRTLIATLPTGFRPVNIIRITGCGASSHTSSLDRVVTGYIDKSGNVNMGDYVSDSSGTKDVCVTESFVVSG